MESWQYPAAVALIVLAAISVGWQMIRFVRSLFTGHGCGSGCGKCHIPDDVADAKKVALPLIQQD